MSQQILALLSLIQLDSANKPPTEVRLFAFGPVRTRKGTFQFTAASAAAVKKQWELYGRSFGFDYEHCLFDSKVAPKDRVASGWAELAIRDDGLWAVGIRWTPDAAKKIADLEFRYLSGAIATDEKRVIVGVENCALTNNPATLDADPLILSALPVAGAPGAAPLLDSQIAKEKRRMDTTPEMKQAVRLAKTCGRMLADAQKAAESDHPAMKALAAGMAEHANQYMAGIKAAFPGMDGAGEPDGDEVALSAEEHKRLTTLAADAERLKSLELLAEKLTDAKGDALKGALVLLSATAKQNVQTTTVNADLARLTLLDSMVRTTEEGGSQQILPQEKEIFLSWSLPELEHFQKTAPRRGPKPLDKVQAVDLNGKPPEVTDEGVFAPEVLAAAKNEALTLLGIDANSPYYTQKGQGLRAS